MKLIQVCALILSSISFIAQATIGDLVDATVGGAGRIAADATDTALAPVQVPVRGEYRGFPSRAPYFYESENVVYENNY